MNKEEIRVAHNLFMKEYRDSRPELKIYKKKYNARYYKRNRVSLLAAAKKRYEENRWGLK